NIIPKTINARWRGELKEVGGFSTWYEGGTKISEFIPGPTNIQFSDIEGWRTPDEISLNVQCNGIVTATVQYCAKIAASPEYVDASDGDNPLYIYISWSMVPCISRYSIWRSTQNNPTTAEKIGEISSGTSYSDTNALPDNQYFYWIRSVNDYGTHGFGTGDSGYLMLGSSLLVKASDGDFKEYIKLEWTDVPGAQSYEIWQSTQNNSTTARLIATVSDTHYLDRDVKPECHFYYWIKAKNGHVTGPKSISDSGFKEFDSVTGVMADDGKYYDQICVNWDPHENATIYDLIIAEIIPTTRTRNARSQNVITTEETHACIVTAVPERRYYFRVLAKNECGESIPSAHDIGYMRLKYPDNIYASCDFTNKVYISWNPVTGAEFYDIWKGPTNNIADAEMLDANVIRTTYTDAVISGQKMYYFVRSRNTYGNSDFSTPVKGCTQSCAYEILESEKTYDLNGTSDQIQISATDGCEWYAESNQPWIHMQESSATGTAFIAYQVDASDKERSGTITIKGTNFEHSVSITQQQKLLVSISGNGMININNEDHSLPFSQLYDGSSHLLITYLPEAGCQFLYWSQDIQGTDNPLNVPLTGNLQLTAHQSCPVNLNFTSIGEGTAFVDSVPISSTVAMTVERGTVITLSASESSDFKYWEIDGDTFRYSPYTLLMDTDKTVMAAFDSGWSLAMTAMSENLGGAYKSTISIGVGLSLKIPAAPLAPKYSCNLSLVDSTDWDLLSTLVFPEGEKSYQWTVYLNPHGNIGSPEPRSCTLTWNPEQLPSEGTFQIREGTDGSGKIHVSNMREQTILVMSGTDETITLMITMSDRSWQATFNAMGENLGGAFKSSVVWGVESVESSLPAPPLPPDYSCRMTIIPVPNWSEERSIDIQPYGFNTYSTVLAINPHGSAGSPEPRSCTITWNPLEFTPSGYYKLRSGYNGTGNEVIANLRDTRQLVVTGEDEIQYFTLIWSESIPFEIVLAKGWNLVSLPRLPENNELKNIFPEANVAYSYEKGEYKIVEKLYPGIGYWIQIDSQKTYNVDGPIYDVLPESMISGWNLIGGGDSVVGLKNLIDDVIVIYKYENGEYLPVDLIEPGFGYWVNMK
ncbi:MAG: hypothetical protein HQK75_16395, partial [Candidatus Magnetomorum sp.]|nr:hypothetical protein [Candidatus Magnetomorum sp.]